MEIFAFVNFNPANLGLVTRGVNAEMREKMLLLEKKPDLCLVNLIWTGGAQNGFVKH